MGKHLDWFAVELERHLETNPSIHLSVLLEEARCHIVASQEALMELGLSEAEAEAEAVKRFGSPSEYVRQIVNVHTGKTRSGPDVKTLAILFIATLFTIVFICLQDAKSPVMWVGWTILATLAIRQMWKVRRFQWELAGFFVPASLILGVVYPILYLNPSNEVKGDLRANRTSEYQTYLEQKIVELKDTEARCLNELSPPPGFVYLYYENETPTHAELEAKLSNVQEDRLRNQQQLATLQAEMNRPFWLRLMRDLRFGLLFGLGWTVLLLGMNLVVWAARKTFDAVAGLATKRRVSG